MAAPLESNGIGEKPKSAGIRKFRRTASIVASTLLTGGSGNASPTKASPRETETQNPPPPTTDAGTAPEPPKAAAMLQRSRSLMHYKPPPQTSTMAPETASVEKKVTSSVPAKASAPASGTSAEDFVNLLKKKKKVSINTKPVSAPAVASVEDTAKKSKSSDGDKISSKSFLTFFEGVSLPLEWLVVLIALIFKLGASAALPLGLMVAGWSFLFMSKIGKRLTSGR